MNSRIIKIKPVVTEKPQVEILTALNPIDEPVTFPVSGYWRPLLGNLWMLSEYNFDDRCRNERHRSRIHLFNIKTQSELILEAELRDEGVGIGVLDDYIVTVTTGGRLGFWKYQDDQITFMSSFNLKLKTKEELENLSSLSIKRLTPNHICLIVGKSRSESFEMPATTIFLIDMTTKSHESYRSEAHSKVVILPSKDNPLKHYMLLHDIGRSSPVKVVDINFGRRWSCGWSWNMRRPWSWFKDKKMLKGGGARRVSATHIARMDLRNFETSALVPMSATNQLFTITEEDGILTPQLLTTFDFVYNQEQRKSYRNRITLFKNWSLYQPTHDLYYCLSFSNPKLYTLAQKGSIETGDQIYDLPNDEIGVVSQEKVLTRYESPDSQLRKIQTFLLFMETILPKPLVSITAQYAFGFFAQDKQEEVRAIECRNEKLAAIERDKIEAKPC